MVRSDARTGAQQRTVWESWFPSWTSISVVRHLVRPSTHSLCLVQEVALVTVCAVFGLVLIQFCCIIFGAAPLLNMIPILLMLFILMFSLVYGYYEA